MRIWTYSRPFQFQGQNYEVKYFFSLSHYTSQLYRNDELIGQDSRSFEDGLEVLEHRYVLADTQAELVVQVGYFSWWSIGIEVSYGGEMVYASHPGKDLHFASKKVDKITGLSDQSPEQIKQQRQLQSEKWQQNKASIFADIGLGAAFFIVAKSTGDLQLAAWTGIVLGLALVVIQRFVKADLLGGFAVFGTVMLLISAVLSLLFQSEYFVQLKGTIMGILGASVLLSDGVFRAGRYFGPRFERYLNSPVEHQYFVIGLGIIGGAMAGINYAIATYLSEDTWLTYNTFLDTPVYLVMFFILVWRAGKRVKQTS